MIDPVPEFVEETPADDREARIVVLFGGAGPVLLEEELDERTQSERPSARYGPARIDLGTIERVNR